MHRRQDRLKRSTYYYYLWASRFLYLAMAQKPGIQRIGAGTCPGVPKWLFRLSHLSTLGSTSKSKSFK